MNFSQQPQNSVYSLIKDKLIEDLSDLEEQMRGELVHKERIQTDFRLLWIIL